MLLFAQVVHDSTESPFLNDLLDKKAFDAAVAKDAAAVARTVLIELFACVEPHPEFDVAWVLFWSYVISFFPLRGFFLV